MFTILSKARLTLKHTVMSSVTVIWLTQFFLFVSTAWILVNNSYINIRFHFNIFTENIHIIFSDSRVTFKEVTAEEHQNEFVRDAFIAGINSHNIRGMLLQKLNLSLDEAVN